MPCRVGWIVQPYELRGAVPADEATQLGLEIADCGCTPGVGEAVGVREHRVSTGAVADGGAKAGATSVGNEKRFANAASSRGQLAADVVVRTGAERVREWAARRVVPDDLEEVPT